MTPATAPARSRVRRPPPPAAAAAAPASSRRSPPAAPPTSPAELGDATYRDLARGRGRRAAAARRAAPPRPPGPPPRRRGQALVAVGRRDRRARPRPRRPGPRLRGRRREPPSPSSASRTGSAAPSTTCAPSGPRSPSRSWPRSSSSTRASCRSCAPPARTSSCSSPRSTRRGVSPDLVARARDLGLEPLVEVHAERELDAALASGARLVGVNSRDLRTLEVDPDHPIRLRARIPDDRIAIAESGARDPATVARWRAAGYDAALVGEALVRAADPRAAAAAFVAAGAVPDDPGAAHRIPFVKICGIVDDAGLDAALAAGADAIGLNFVAGHAARAVDRRGRRAGRAAPAPPAGPGRRPSSRSSANAGRRAARGARRGGERRRDPVRRRGATRADRASRRAPPGRSSTSRRPRPTTRPRARRVVDAAVARARAHLAAGAARIVLDTAGGPHPGGTGTRADTSLAAAVAREVPVILAGGLDPASVAGALLAVPAVGVDVASGVEAPRVAGERPRKDPLAVALFAKRARAARFDRPNTPAGPTPVHPGLLEADARGHWGVERDFGGRFVPETLVGALEQLEAAWAVLRDDPVFWAELRELLARFAGRPTALYRADRLADAVLAEAARRARWRATAGARPPPRRRSRPPASPPQARGPRPHRRPQDQQRPRPGAPHPAPGQDPGHRRDRRRPARRRHRDRLRAARPALRRLHGRGGHPAPGAERPADAGPRGRGPLGHLRHGDPQGRRQRGDAGLGDERRHDPLRPRQRDGPAPVPDDRPRPAAPDRRRGGGPAARRRGAPAGPRPRLRRGRLERDRAPRPLHRGAVRAAGRGRGCRRRDRDRAPRGGDPRRHAGDPPRLALAHAPGPRRAGGRGGERLGRPRLPGRRAAAGGARRGRADLARQRHRPRGGGGDEGRDAHRGDPARRSRRPTRSRRCRSCWRGRRAGPGPPAGELRRPPGRTRRVVLVGFSGRGDKDLAALERFADVEPWEGVR